MAGYRLSASATDQFGEILGWSERRFGADARDRYAAIILAAMRNVAEDPRQANVHWRRVRNRQIGVYHIAHSRDRVPVEVGRVTDPRHYLVFAIGGDDVVEVLGFVHDSMLLGRAFRRLTQP